MGVHLELRHLRYFLAVAEELNFSRAAERLHIAQPALSAQIRTLESQLGCRLFLRTTRRVELTPSGKQLLDDARDILARADEAVAKVRAVARGELGVVRIGFVAHGAGEVGTEIVRRFAAALPTIETQLVESATLEEVQWHVRDRTSDVAFVWLPLLYEELEVELIRTEQVFIGMHLGHRLATRPTLTRSDVTPEPIVAPWDEVPFEILAPWLEQFRPAGRRPDDPNGKGLAECLSIASQGAAVYCVPDSVPRYHARPDLVFLPVADATPGHVAVVWHRETRNPAVASFVDIAREVVGGSDRSAGIQSDGF